MLRDITIVQAVLAAVSIDRLRLYTIDYCTRPYQRKWANQTLIPVLTVRNIIHKYVHYFIIPQPHLSNVEHSVGKDIQPRFRMCDWDQVFGNLRSSFKINVVILSI